MSNKPIETFYAGNTEVAVWENQGEERIFHSITAKRSYLDTNGEWKEAGTVHLLPQQIPDMILALQKSHEFLRMGLRQRRKQQSATNENPQPTTGERTDEAELATPEAQTSFAGKEAERRKNGSRTKS